MRYQIDEREGAVYAVIQAVAAYENREMKSLPPIGDTINGDALNAIHPDESDPSLRISFHYSDSHILIENGTVFVSSEELVQRTTESQM